MQNIHSHAWNQAKHIAADTVREADLSRGYPLDLSVAFDSFMEDMQPFEKVVVFGLKARQTGYWVPDEYIANFVSRSPSRLIGFASCDPTQDGYMEELIYANDVLHLKGLKMGPMYAGFDPRDPRCEPVYQYCEKHSLPIIFHSGTTFNHAAPLSYSRPWLFDEVAIRHPNMTMVLAHLAHPFFEECLVVIRKHPHVYADISALFYRPWQFYNMMVTAQEYHVMHKLLFGTDYPFARSQESIQGVRGVNQLVRETHLPVVDEEQIEAILNRDSLSFIGVSA